MTSAPGAHAFLCACCACAFVRKDFGGDAENDSSREHAHRRTPLWSRCGASREDTPTASDSGEAETNLTETPHRCQGEAGPYTAASGPSVRARDLELRPRCRPATSCKWRRGLYVAQHAGGEAIGYLPSGLRHRPRHRPGDLHEQSTQQYGTPCLLDVHLLFGIGAVSLTYVADTTEQAMAEFEDAVMWYMKTFQKYVSTPKGSARRPRLREVRADPRFARPRAVGAAAQGGRGRLRQP